MSATPAKQDAGTLEVRIVVERRAAGGRWSAWFHQEPAVSSEADEAMAAFDALLVAHRERLPDPYQLRVDDRRSRGGHIEVLVVGRRRERKPCPTCKGTGKYVGLTVVEPCTTCKGTGSVPAA